jgi:hypothetical protein
MQGRKKNSVSSFEDTGSVRRVTARLTEAGVLSQVTVGKRNRAFEATEVINAFTDLERQLASPGGDTRSPAGHGNQVQASGQG